MDDETSYWLQIGEGENQYRTQVPRETFMAMERECGFHGEPNELATNGFEVPASPGYLRTKGWLEFDTVVST